MLAIPNQIGECY